MAWSPEKFPGDPGQSSKVVTQEGGRGVEGLGGGECGRVLQQGGEGDTRVQVVLLLLLLLLLLLHIPGGATSPASIIVQGAL